jgi:hypothetical protein
MLDTARWGARMYTLTMSDDYISLWKKAGIYDILYGNNRVTCEKVIPELTLALTDMCVHYLDYRQIAKFPSCGDKVEDSMDNLLRKHDKAGGFMDELLREQVFRQAVAILAMLIQAASLYPHAIICRQKEEAT